MKYDLVNIRKCKRKMIKYSLFKRYAALVTTILITATIYINYETLEELVLEDVLNASEAIYNPIQIKKRAEIEFQMEKCGCSRNLKGIYPNPSYIKINQTTCGSDAFHRGPHQKVIGFSFYGDVNSDRSKRKGYFEGILANLELIPKFYPGWTMRLYHDLNGNDPLLQDICDLACHDSNIDICDIKNLPGTPLTDALEIFPMNWRFFPTLDPQVDLYMSRDLDSHFGEREQAAVEEWLRSNKEFHFIRDHPNHGYAILGGMWGCKMSPRVRSQWKNTWKSAFSYNLMWAKRTNDLGPDLKFLEKYVWFWAKDISISHDSYTCRSYPYTKSFPTQRKNEINNFVGAVVGDEWKIWEECPIKCRPKDHLDWKHC